MCGIFGASLNPKVMDRAMTKAAIAKFKMLGIYNVERGKHSCGIYMGDMIMKGVDNDKLFYDFISAHELPDPMKSGNFTMIGHTRAATHGSHIAANAHPFRVDDNFVLAHNGVIRNVWQLCNKYKINHSGIHVDSLGLAHLINQEGFNILNEYEGFAALLMTRQSEPNAMYVYRGVSRRVKDGAEEEERPLFYLQAEEGIYFSSLEKSLLAISDHHGDRIKQLEGNVVWKVTNGVFTKVKHHINRDAVNVGINPNTNGGNPHTQYPKPPGNTAPHTTTGSSTPTVITPNGTNSRVGATHPVIPPIGNFGKPVIPIIFFETLPNRVKRYEGKKGVIYHQGRYWVVSGDELSMAHGSYYINKKGVISPQKVKSAHNWFFYEGVLMKSQAAYRQALVDSDLKNIFWNFAMHISRYADYPVCNSKYNVKDSCKDVAAYYKYRWFQNGNMCSNTAFTPKFSDRNYVIKDGLLNAIGVQKIAGVPTESTLDVDALNKERAGEPPMTIAPVQQAVIREMLNTAKQDELPFPIIDEKKEDPKKEDFEWDFVNFYRVWDSLEQARSTFSELEINAMRFYVADIMMNEMNVYPESIKEDQVDVQLNMFLSICVETGATVMDQWDEKNYDDILGYLIIAKDNPSGNIYDAPVEEIDLTNGEVCEFVPKPEGADIVDVEARIALMEQAALEQKESVIKETVEKLVPPTPDRVYAANNTNPQDAMDNGFMIDSVIAREQASIPKKEDDPEGPFYTEEVVEDGDELPNQERDYAIQDTADYLNSCRECADELQAREEDDFAQEAAAIIYRIVDPALSQLEELTSRYNEGELQDYIRDVIGKRVNV